MDKLETQEGCSSSLNACMLETQESLMFQFKPKDREKPVTQLKAIRPKEFPLTAHFLFCSGLQLIG